MEIVEVKWVDSVCIEGWRSRSSMKKLSQKDEQVVVRSVGYLLHETKKYLTIIQGFSPGYVQTTLKIPVSAVIETRNLS